MPYRLSRRAATLEPIGCLKGGHITVLDMEMQGTRVEASPTHSHVFWIGGRPLDQSGHSAHAGTQGHTRNCSFADRIIEEPLGQCQREQPSNYLQDLWLQTS